MVAVDPKHFKCMYLSLVEEKISFDRDFNMAQLLKTLNTAYDTVIL